MYLEEEALQVIRETMDKSKYFGFSVLPNPVRKEVFKRLDLFPERELFKQRVVAGIFDEVFSRDGF
ncbi:MAG: hypothetical protein BWX50_00125 [Euryarchaeota archaeon ADurb.Bin009]|nr:MAG: hypothetical protein BWX50_00125 [Euryarchaeota archaeon ADurb.Bin009]